MALPHDSHTVRGLVLALSASVTKFSCICKLTGPSDDGRAWETPPMEILELRLPWHLRFKDHLRTFLEMSLDQVHPLPAFSGEICAFGVHAH